MGSRLPGGCGLLIIGGLELHRRPQTEFPEQTAVVEPVHVLQRGVLDVVQPPPRSSPGAVLSRSGSQFDQVLVVDERDVRIL